jgi:hypothetical protein
VLFFLKPCFVSDVFSRFLRGLFSSVHGVSGVCGVSPLVG